MRLPTFDSKPLRQHLQRHKIATLDELKAALGTPADLTVFRKLKPLGYRTSYTHRGRYYTLDAIARFDNDGLWSHEGVWFSRQGTLLATAEHFVTHSPQGLFAHELADTLHVEVQDALHQLALTERLRRTQTGGLYLYTAPERSTHRLQLSSRRVARTVPLATHVGDLQVSPEELQGAIVLFWVFPSENGTPLSRDNVWRRRIGPKLESVELGWVDFHVMRRTHATLMREIHDDPKLVADQLGHTVDVNQNVYTRASVARRKEAVDALENALPVM